MSEPFIACGACGARNPVEAIVCVKCGALLSAYQSEPIAASERPAINDPDLDGSPAEAPVRQPPSQNAGATGEIFGPDEIELQPTVVEPLDVETHEPERIARSSAEPVEAEFRTKLPPAPPLPPRSKPTRLTATTVQSSNPDDPLDPADSQNMFGSRYPTGRIVVWSLGRRSRLLYIAGLLLVVVACPLMFMAHGALALLGVCLAAIAIFGATGVLIGWARPKRTSSGRKRA